MATPKEFNNVIKAQLNVFAAWMPIVNNYKLGDYGIISDGVFAKLGNIKDDFNIQYVSSQGDDASIDFTSEGATVAKFNAGAKVDVIPAGAVDAKIDIQFSKERSFLIKSPTIKVNAIDNVNNVADKLFNLKEWDGKWKVVYQVYTATDPVVVASIAADTKLTFSGNATALGNMKLGDAGVSIDTNKTLGLKFQGKNGVLGLALFRVKTKIFGGHEVETLAHGDIGANKVEYTPLNAADDL